MKRIGIRDDAIGDSSSGGDGNEDKRRRRCRIINSLRRTLILSSFATLSLIFLAMTTRSREVTVIEVPSCTNTPWESDEDLRGKCPESFKSIPSAKSITQCATSCCEDLNCITWLSVVHDLRAFPSKGTRDESMELSWNEPAGRRRQTLVDQMMVYLLSKRENNCRGYRPLTSSRME